MYMKQKHVYSLCAYIIYCSYTAQIITNAPSHAQLQGALINPGKFWFPRSNPLGVGDETYSILSLHYIEIEAKLLPLFI